jgi:hypothetical protein
MVGHKLSLEPRTVKQDFGAALVTAGRPAVGERLIPCDPGHLGWILDKNDKVNIISVYID